MFDRMARELAPFAVAPLGTLASTIGRCQRILLPAASFELFESGTFLPRAAIPKLAN